MTGKEQSQVQSSSGIVSPSISSPTAVSFVCPATPPVRTQKTPRVNAQSGNIHVIILIAYQLKRIIYYLRSWLANDGHRAISRPIFKQHCFAFGVLAYCCDFHRPCYSSRPYAEIFKCQRTTK